VKATGMSWKVAAAAVSVVAAAGAAFAYQKAKPEAPIAMPVAQARNLNAWQFRLTAIDGTPLPMRKFQGQVVMLVNTASFCGFTNQYEGLEALQKAYAARGFTVIGVPSGDFMGQEYGSNSEIASFCNAKFGIRFPLTEKSRVVGPKAIPIYRWAAARLGPDNGPKWNFHKYLIGRDGRPIAAFPSKVAPNAPEVRTAIEAALKAPRPA